MLIIFIVGQQQIYAQHRIYYNWAKESLKTTNDLYLVDDGKYLFRETYPFDEQHQATYLGTTDNSKANLYSYLWPFSGSLSAYAALYEVYRDNSLLEHIDREIWPGLRQYEDFREPFAYASYIKEASMSDRFYDDNIWLGIDFTDLYLGSKKIAYLEEAHKIWTFIKSGMDDELGGGIYWCEQRKESKNTCSNAPAVVFLLKLYEATQDISFLNEAKSLYAWTKNTLQDPADKLYWDNINLSKKIDRAKYPYNTGQMIQAGALLFKITGEKSYLFDAQASAVAGYNHFFHHDKVSEIKSSYPILKQSDNWFIAVMLRGYVELYAQDSNKIYIDAFKSNLDYAWSHMRDAEGLFGKDWLVKKEAQGKKWLLDQFAFAEMYARLAALK